MVLHCDELSVVNMTPPNGKERDVELAAVGNAVAEGSDDTFTARAAASATTRRRTCWFCEGDGRTDAELFRQQTPGGAVRRLPDRRICTCARTISPRSTGPARWNSTDPGDRNNKKNGLPLPGVPVR